MIDLNKIEAKLDKLLNSDFDFKKWLLNKRKKTELVKPNK